MDEYTLEQVFSMPMVGSTNFAHKYEPPTLQFFRFLLLLPSSPSLSSNFYSHAVHSFGHLPNG